MPCTSLVLDISYESGTIVSQAVCTCPFTAPYVRRETLHWPLSDAKCSKLGDKKNAKKYLSIAKEKGYSKDSIDTICRELHLFRFLI